MSEPRQPRPASPCHVSPLTPRSARVGANTNPALVCARGCTRLKASFEIQPVENRDGGKIEAPTLYDIAGSANWANKADLGWAVHRRNFESAAVEIHVHKVRHKWIGTPGGMTLHYDRATGRYSEPASSSARVHWKD